MKEIWQTIEGYEDYMVSSKGRTAKILKGDGNGRGYRFIRFPDGKRIYKHRLVAQAFIPNPNKLPFINHKDGNKENNEVENLEWCTNQHNTKEAYRIGLHKPILKPVIQKTLEGKKVKEWDSIKKASGKTGVSRDGIGKCCNKKIKTSGGYIWEHKEKEE